MNLSTGFLVNLLIKCLLLKIGDGEMVKWRLEKRGGVEWEW